MNSFLAEPHYPKLIFEKKGSLILASHPTNEKNANFLSQFFFNKPLKTKLWDKFSSNLNLYFSKIKTITITKMQLKKMPSYIKRKDCPTKDEHANIVDKFLKSTMKKAVIARKTELTFKEDLDLTSLIEHLLATKTNAHFFALIIGPNEAFFGATPETLFDKTGRIITTEALAATTTITSSMTLFNQKELEEFHLTRDSILQTMRSLSKDIEYNPKEQIKKTAHLLHLHTKIQAKLNKNIAIQDITKALHPTPAMGGITKIQASNFIYKHEKFDRGLFASPFCFTHQNQTHCLVAIRSALLQGKHLHLFAGSGCIKGSSAHSEWQELDEKIKPFISQFGFTKALN